jgi:hypothetical protein
MKNSFFSNSVKQLILVSLLFVVSTTIAQWKEQTTGGSVGYQNAVRYSATGDLYTVLQDASNGNKVTVQKQNGATWSIVGTAGFSTYMVYKPTMAVNQANGDLYVAYIESISGVFKLSCNKFNGTSWVDVGAPEFLTTGGTGNPGMTINSSGNPVIVTPTSTTTFQVFQFNGSSWDNLTSGAVSNYNSLTPLDMVYTWGDRGPDPKNNYFPYADSNGDIYVAVSTAMLSSPGITVFKYSSGTWTQVGATLAGGSASTYQRVTKSPDGTLYIAYSQTSNTNSICKIYVYKWSGSAWIDLSNGGTGIYNNTTNNNFNGFSLDIAFDSNSVPYVLYQNSGNDWRAYVKKYNTSTSNWDMARSGQVGGFYMDAGMRLFIDNVGLPYYVGTSSSSEPRVYVVETKPVFSTTSFLPSSGIVGSTVNLYGANFTGTTNVSFNGTTAAFTVNSNTSITATVPANATSGAISVTNAAGTSTTSSNYTVVFPKPIITSFSPVVASSGNTLTLNGTGFSSVLTDNVVYISGIKCTLISATTTSITLTVPPGISTGKINYTNIASSFSTISDEDFIAKFSYPSGITTLLPGNYAGNGSVTVATDNSVTGYTDRFSFCDFNEDQKPDIIMYAGKVKLKYFTNGSSAGSLFQATDMASSDLYSATSTGTGSHALLGDYDGDGDLDIFGALSGFSGSNWFKNTSTGGTVSVNSIGDITSTTFCQGANTIDINRDGKIDWIGVYDSGNPLAYTQFLNSTAGVSSNFSFTSSGSQTVLNIKAITRVADMDGNGFQDFLVGYTNGIKIRPNINGVLTSASDLNITTTSTPYDIRVVDFDLDGKKDIVMTGGSGTGSANITVLQNTTANGTLSFATPATFASGGTYTYGLAIADANNDGLPDVLVGCANKLVLFINNSTSGAISFSAAQDLGTAAANLISLSAIDLNADGAMDIVGFTQNGLTLKYFVFAPAPEITVTSNLTSFSKCGTTATPQTFTVSGVNLTANIALATLSGYEYS